MLKKVIPVIKPVGLTPLQAVEGFKIQNSEYKNETISYAGRLDPMAEGLLLLLIGAENKKRSEYEGWEKAYETEFVLGIATDTYDALGIARLENSKNKISVQDVEKKLSRFVGKQLQEYPPYSSKPVNGKPLYWWARNNRISEIEIPAKNIEIYSIELLDSRIINASDLLGDILARIQKVSGNFRQEEIAIRWRDMLESDNSDFLLIRIRIECSSGTYIRGLIHDLGEVLGAGAFALTINRMQIGQYLLSDLR